MRLPLLVPCVDEAFGAALASGADALVVDLDAPGPPGGRAARRRAAADLLRRARTLRTPPLLAVRVATLPTGLVDADLDAVMAGEPDAVLLPGAAGAVDVEHLAAKLAVREAERGLMAGRTRILASAADTARAVLALPSLPGASPRLLAMVWDPAALAADLGLADETVEPCRVARGLVLVAAAAARVPAFVVAPGKSAPAPADCRAAARRDGFAGLLALRPDQVVAIGEGPSRTGTADGAPPAASDGAR